MRTGAAARARMSVVWALVGLVAPLAASAPAPQAAVAPVHDIVVDGRDSGRTFDGVGAVSAGGSSRLLLDYPKRERVEILDYLFEPNYGAALDILKVEIGGDVDATVGAEASHMRTPDEVDCDRGYEWWLMREAKERNPRIDFYGLPWGAPGWFDGGYWSKDKVKYLISWLDCAKKHDLEIAYLGAGNESSYDRDFSVALDAALERNGYADVQIVATDNHHPPDYWFAAGEMRDDPEFADAVDVLGEHDVCVWRTLQRRCHVSADALALDKPLWDSENSTQDFQVGPGPLARAMNRHYIDGRITGNLNWALVAAWYDNFPIGGTGLMTAERPWSGHYEVGPSIWVDAHTTQFTEPGWQYLDGGSDYTDNGSSYVSLRSPATDDYSTVVETMDLSAAETLRFHVRGGLSRDRVHVWSTNLSTRSTADDFVRQDDLRVRDGSFSLNVEPGHVYTVSTTTGQAKGAAQSSADPGEQLSVPYAEDFEQVGRQGLARYFADVHGAFEAAPCAGGRAGTCYRQVVTQEPITWHGTALPPTTMVGDPRWWGDYTVSVDALLEENGAVELLGRVDSQQHNASGYHLKVADTGKWRLYTEDARGRTKQLASGTTTPPGTGSWHRLSLRFRGDRITARLDGERLAAVTDDEHTTGQVGLRVAGWQRAQFDDLRVTPTARWPRFVRHSRMSATATSEHAANDRGHVYTTDLAVDDRLWSSWRSEYAPPAGLPQSITVDLGRTRRTHGLAYTPSVTGAAGAITGYTAYASTDGESFTEVASGWWEPTGGTKTVAFDEPVRARYVRLEAVDVQGCPRAATVTELNVSRTPLPTLGEGEPPEQPDPGYQHLVPQSTISATATSRQPGYEAGKAVDGNCATMWHSSWSPPEPPPQSITFDLARSYETKALVYQPRQDGNVNGMTTGYTVEVSDDGESFTEVARGQWSPDDTTKVAEWSAKSARYVRLTAVDGVNGYVSAAEVNVAHTGR